MDPQDIEQFNSIQITQRYLIPNIWKAAAQKNSLACEFFAQGIMDRLYVPAKKERKWPLAVSFPENFIQRIEIQTPDQWRILPSEKTIQTKSLLFRYKKACTNNQITIVWQLLPLREAVTPGEMTDHLAAIDQIPQFLGLTVTKPIPGTSQSGSPNCSVWIGVVSYHGILLIAPPFLYTHHPTTPPTTPP